MTTTEAAVRSQSPFCRRVAPGCRVGSRSDASSRPPRSPWRPPYRRHRRRRCCATTRALAPARTKRAAAAAAPAAVVVVVVVAATAAARAHPLQAASPSLAARVRGSAARCAVDARARAERDDERPTRLTIRRTRIHITRAHFRWATREVSLAEGCSETARRGRERRRSRVSRACQARSSASDAFAGDDDVAAAPPASAARAAPVPPPRAPLA